MEMVVLTCGLLYGGGERIFDVFFRKAWETSDDGVPIIGDGDNKIPTIHVTVRSQPLFQFPGRVRFAGAAVPALLPGLAVGACQRHVDEACMDESCMVCPQTRVNAY